MHTSVDFLQSYCLSTGAGDSEQLESVHTESENVATKTLEEPDKSSKANSEIRKTWGFRRSTVAKREMPVEAATNASENRCPVRRSGRQSKRTDKLEEFLLTAKRGSRKSAPPSLESGDPPSQTPTDAETASEASFDGNADTKGAEDKVESPERRTRSSARRQAQRKTRGRQTRGGGGSTVNEEGSSENEEDSRDGAKKDESQDNNGEKMDEKSEPSPEELGISNTTQSQPELVSEKEEVAEEADEHGNKNNKAETETVKDGEDKPAALVKRGPIRTYINKKKAANKKTAPVKAPVPANKSAAPLKRDATSKATGKTRKSQMEEDNDDEDDDDDEDDEDDDDDDDDENDSSTSSSSIESDDGGYDPNALYCICRQRHNKRYLIRLNLISWVLLCASKM